MAQGVHDDEEITLDEPEGDESILGVVAFVVTIEGMGIEEDGKGRAEGHAMFRLVGEGLRFVPFKMNGHQRMAIQM